MMNANELADAIDSAGDNRFNNQAAVMLRELQSELVACTNSVHQHQQSIMWLFKKHPNIWAEMMKRGGN